MNNIVYCPQCESTDTYFHGYDDGYECEHLFGIAEMWMCETCGTIFEIEDADIEFRQNPIDDDTENNYDKRTS